MNFPKITIITPSFNQGQFLEETILSVIDQNYPNLEYIIVDGGSTDRSIEIIKKYEKHLSYWISEKDQGQADAINKGLRKSTGEIIGYLNSDDCLYPDTLKKVAKVFSLSPNEKIILSGKSFIGTAKEIDSQGHVFSPFSEGWDLLTIVRGYGIFPQPSVFWTSSSLEFSKELNFTLDYKYWVDLIRDDYRVVLVEDIFSFYRIHPESKGMTITDQMWSETLSLHFYNHKYFYKPNDLLRLQKSSIYKIREYYIASITKNVELWRRLDIMRLFLYFSINNPTILNLRMVKFLLKKFLTKS